MNEGDVSAFLPELKAAVHPDVWRIMDEVPRAVAHAENAVRLFDQCFNLHNLGVAQVDPRQVLNQYIDAILASCLSKYVAVNRSMIDCANRHDFLCYALSRRSMIETTATLWYYLHKKIHPLMDKCRKAGQVSNNDFRQLFDQLHRYLMGSRFDWETLFIDGFNKLSESYSDWLVRKQRDRNAKKWEAKPLICEQVNVATCLEAWAREDPRIGVIYDLFCDMVHPNAGSTLCVTVSTNDGMRFRPGARGGVGSFLFAISYGPLQALIGKEFAKCIEVIPLLKYAPSEF